MHRKQGYHKIIRSGELNFVIGTMTLGSYIKDRRKALRMTQEDLADKLASLGVQRGASIISQWENDHSQPPFEVISKLADALEESSPNRLLSLGGYLESVKGNNIIDLLYGQSDDVIDMVSQVIRVIINNQENGS